MSWNYRIVTETVNSVNLYWIAEVYYDKNGNPDSCSGREFNVLSDWDDIDDLIGTVEKTHEALNKPVLRVVNNRLTTMESKE